VAKRAPPLTTDEPPPTVAKRAPPITTDEPPPPVAKRAPPITTDESPPTVAKRAKHETPHPVEAAQPNLIPAPALARLEESLQATYLDSAVFRGLRTEVQALYRAELRGCMLPPGTVRRGLKPKHRAPGGKEVIDDEFGDLGGDVLAFLHTMRGQKNAKSL
jgi:hypothetical protein